MKKIIFLLICNFSLLCEGIAQWQNANTGFYGGIITALTTDPSTNYLYTAIYNSGVFLSTNNGSTWNPISNGLPSDDLDVNSIANSGGSILAGTNEGVFLSSNNGSSWTAVNNGLSNLNVLSIISDGDNIFAGTYNGVFLQQMGAVPGQQ